MGESAVGEALKPRLRPDYWRWAATVVGVMIAIVVVRVHELVPALALARPALLSAGGGTYLLWKWSSAHAKQSAFRDPTFRLVLMYIGWILICSVTALWIAQAAETVQTLIPSVLLVLALLLVPPTEHAVEVVIRFLVLATAFFSVMLLVAGKQLVEGRVGISNSLDPNDAAAIMALTLPLAIAAGIRSPSLAWRAAHWVSVALLLAGLGATSSRGGTLAMLAGAITLVLAAPGAKKFAAIAAAIVVGVVAWEQAPPAFHQRMTALFSGEKDYNSTSYNGREAVWQRARSYMWHNPILGVGPGNFPIAEGNFLTEAGGRGKWSTTHNSYLQAGSELGLPGALLFTALVIGSMRRAKRWWRRSSLVALHRPEFLASIVAFAVSAVFLSHAYFYALFGLIGLIALADRMLMRRRAELLPALQERAMLQPERTGHSSTDVRSPRRIRAAARHNRLG